MAAWMTARVWELREGAKESDLLSLMDKTIARHYERLHPQVRLGLIRMGERRYLVAQRWPDQATFQKVTSDPGYQAWLDSYRDAVERLQELAVFVEEWAGEELR